MPIDRILVALDGSRGAEHGLTYAVALARQMGGQGPHPSIFLAQTTRPRMLPMTMDPERLSLDLLEAAWTYLGGIARPLRAEGLDIKIIVRTGPAAATLLEIIEQNAINLVIMATHARTGIARWARGSVAEIVAARAPVPVMLVPHEDPAAGEALSNRTWRILVPIADMVTAESALAPIVPLARTLAAEVRLLHVARPDHPGRATRPVGAEGSDRHRLHRIEQLLEEQVRHLRRLGIAARWSVGFGSPAEHITICAARYQSDIVVLPRRWRGQDTLIASATAALAGSTLPWADQSIPQWLLSSGQSAVLFITTPGLATTPGLPLEVHDYAARA